MPFIIVTIITLSAILTLICSTILKDKLDPKDYYIMRLM